MRGTGQLDMRRVDEEAVGRLRVNDEAITVGILGDSEDAVDREGISGETEHAERDHAANQLHVLSAAASNTCGLQGLCSIE